jgi:alcohol dehydrogenase (cytochrome c)
MNRSIRNALFASSMLIAAGPAIAANVTPERLANPDREPQNWLMNHRCYDGQRFSPLARINTGNVKGLKLAYTVALGGTAANEYVQATPLAENGFLYITDSWGILYKIDGSSGDAGHIVWRMDPKQQKQDRNRGAALWGNFVITAANNPPQIVATDKETGKVVCETGFPDTPDVAMTSAPLPIKDKIVIGAAVNIGTGFTAPPMTFEVNGRQYVAIASGPSSVARSKLVNTPELKEMRNATVLYVFGL